MARSQRDAAYVWLATGAVLAGLSVILAAIGDHTLRGELGIAQARLFELGTRYQFYHALAIMLCGLIGISTPLRGSSWAAFFFLLGILGFSGGLYVRIALPTIPLGWIIPAGAVIWIIAWILLAVVAVLRIGEPTAFPQTEAILPKETPSSTVGKSPQ